MSLSVPFSGLAKPSVDEAFDALLFRHYQQENDLYLALKHICENGSPLDKLRLDSICKALPIIRELLMQIRGGLFS